MKLQGKFQFPLIIIPKRKYLHIIDFDKLFEQQDVYLLRRIDLERREDVFNQIGLLRADALKPRDIPLLSLNLLGGYFKKKHAKFRILRSAAKKWNGKEQVFFIDYKSEFEILGKYFLVYFYANNLHKQEVPYKQNKKSKGLGSEVEKFFKHIEKKPLIEGEDYLFKGEAKVVHDPIKLNYWHVEYNLIDFKGDPFKNNGSAYLEKFCTFVITDILCINSFEKIDNPISIKKKYFIK